MASQSTERLALPVRPSIGKGVARQLLANKGMGRSNPLYEFLEPLSDEVFMIFDDFVGNSTLDDLYGDIWTASNNGGNSAAPVHLSTNSWKGELYFDTGTTDDSISYLIGNEIPFYGQYRATINGSFYITDVDKGKFEFGFADGANNAGAVLAKSTPTANATDFAVACYDYDDLDGTDNAESPTLHGNVDLISNGTTDATVTNTSGWTTVTTDGIADSEIKNIMISIDETRSCRMWVDGQFSSRSTIGPDLTVAVYPWVCIMLRDSPGTQNYLYLDYIRAWQERVAIA